MDSEFGEPAYFNDLCDIGNRRRNQTFDMFIIIPGKIEILSYIWVL